MKSLTTDPETLPYNKVVRKAFDQILSETLNIIAKVKRDELRCTLYCQIKPAVTNMVVYEFINPLFYLKLYCENDGRFSIHYGFECGNIGHEFSSQTALFTRAIYRLTAREHTAQNIEASVQTDWLITECSALFEQLEDKFCYKFALVKHKPVNNRKRMKAVA